MGYGVWELRGNFSTKCFDVAKLGMGLVSCPLLTNRLNKQNCQPFSFCVKFASFLFYPYMQKTCDVAEKAILAKNFFCGNSA